MTLLELKLDKFKEVKKEQKENIPLIINIISIKIRLVCKIN